MLSPSGIEVKNICRPLIKHSCCRTHCIIFFIITCTCTWLVVIENCDILIKSVNIMYNVLHEYIISSPEPKAQGELIGYSWSGVRPASGPPFTMLKGLLLQNRLASQSQILCGASLGRGNESLFGASGSHDQDGRQAHIW